MFVNWKFADFQNGGAMTSGEHMKAQISAAIAGAHIRQLDHVAKQLWSAHGAGLITDDEAVILADALEARRNRPRLAPRPPAAPRRQRSPDRQRSIARRRGLAATGAMPPQIAAMFSTGEQAALVIIALEVQRRGACDMPMDEIAARAGTSRTTARNAIRAAEAHGLILRTERRIARDRNDTNVLRITSPEWLNWLRLAPMGGRMQKCAEHGYQFRNNVALSSPHKLLSGKGSAAGASADRKRGEPDDHPALQQRTPHRTSA